MSESNQRPSLAKVPPLENPEDSEGKATSAPEARDAEASDEASDEPSGPAAAEPAGLAEERPGAEEAPAPRSAEERPGGRAWKLASLLLLAAVVVCVLLLLQQVRRAEVLEREVGVLSAELSGARTRLALYESRMAEVRQGVSDLFGQVAGLRDLVNERLPGEPRRDAAAPPQPAQPGTPPPGAPEPPGGTLPGVEGRPGARL